MHSNHLKTIPVSPPPSKLLPVIFKNQLNDIIPLPSSRWLSTFYNIKSKLPMWNSKAFPNDSNTLLLIPNNTHLQPHRVTHSTLIKALYFCLSSSFYLKWLIFIFQKANSLFSKVLPKCYFSKPSTNQELITVSSFPHFPILNHYRSVITAWLALCKCLPPSSIVNISRTKVRWH